MSDSQTPNPNAYQDHDSNQDSPALDATTKALLDAVGDGKDVAGIVEFLDSELGMLIAGDPALSPRQQKQRRKGLPPVEDLRKLARTWLNQAHKLYPDLAKSAVVPPNNQESVENMVKTFVTMFVNGDPQPVLHDLKSRGYQGTAATYIRYSDDNSNARSLDDQLAQAMKKAADEGRFMPWEYCFADASVSGRSAMRRGYRLAKEALERYRGHGLDSLYIDDFSRASRAAIETYRLARLMEVLKLRLIGVNDGFVLGTEAAQIHIMAAAMFNQWFIDQLRKKVLRGMKGAAARGTALGAVRLGYKLVNKLDDNGNAIITTKNMPLRIPVVDDDTKGHVIQAARWFAEDHLSYKEIARRFNAEKVNGSTSWTGSHISKMLACETYTGVRIYNRNQTLWDKETGEYTVEPNPESEWVVTEMPQLRIIDDDLWERLRARADEVAAKSNRTGKKLNRKGQALPECQVNDLYPTTIVDGVLFCSSCGRAMRLVRSEGESKQVGCPNGSQHTHGCKLHSSKSLRLITAGLSRYIKDKVLTKERIGELVAAANEYLAEETSKPRNDLAPLRQALADAQREEEHVVNLVCKLKDEHDVTRYMAKSDELREKVVYLQKQLTEAEAANAEPPPPLDLDTVLAYLDDLRGLLEQNVEKSAHALQTLLGKVMVYEAAIPGRKRKAWVAKIDGDLVALMAHAAKFDGIPDPDTWEFLRTRIWSFTFSAEIRLNDPPKYERHAEEFKALHDDGVSIELIASRYGMSPHWVVTAIKFATTGERPQVRPSRRNHNYAGKPAKYIVIADDVSRLKVQKMTMPQIINWLAEHRDINVSIATVRRAWDYANPGAVRQAVEDRTTPADRAQHRHLSAEKIDVIKQMLVDDHRVADIAKEVGCGKNTVYRIRRDL